VPTRELSAAYPQNPKRSRPNSESITFLEIYSHPIPACTLRRVNQASERPMCSVSGSNHNFVHWPVKSHEKIHHVAWAISWRDLRPCVTPARRLAYPDTLAARFRRRSAELRKSGAAARCCRRRRPACGLSAFRPQKARLRTARGATSELQRSSCQRRPLDRWAHSAQSRLTKHLRPPRTADSADAGRVVDADVVQRYASVSRWRSSQSALHSPLFCTPGRPHSALPGPNRSWTRRPWS